MTFLQVPFHCHWHQFLARGDAWKWNRLDSRGFPTSSGTVEFAHASAAASDLRLRLVVHRMH